MVGLDESEAAASLQSRGLVFKSEAHGGDLAPTADPATPTSTTLGHSLLGVTAGWDLFGWGQGGMVRIQPAKGVVTVTPVPSLNSSNLVDLVVGSKVAVIRSQDNLPGYAVPDGKAAEELPPALSRGGPMLPGPKPDQVWVESPQSSVMDLFGWDGRPTGVSIPFPPLTSFQGWPATDDAGYVLLHTDNGVYDATPKGIHRVTTGVVSAIGPTGFLAWECDDSYRCGTVAIDRTTGARRAVHAVPVPPEGDLGVISPDGGTAAMVGGNILADSPTSTETSPEPTAVLGLIDLALGTTTAVPVEVDPQSGPVSMAFSPDSRWLFVSGVGGKLYAVNVRSHAVTDLTTMLNLGPVTQLAIRPTAN